MPIDDRSRDPRIEWQGQPTEEFRIPPALLERYISTPRRQLRQLSIVQYVGVTAGVAASIRVAVVGNGSMLRLGAVLMALLFAFVLLMLYLAPRGRDGGSAIPAPFVESYRAELERHRWLFSGYRLWSRLVLGIPVATVFCVGLAQANPARSHVIYLQLAAIVASLVISCLLAHRKARAYQREIDELDALRL